MARYKIHISQIYTYSTEIEARNDEDAYYQAGLIDDETPVDNMDGFIYNDSKFEIEKIL